MSKSVQNSQVGDGIPPNDEGSKPWWKCWGINQKWRDSLYRKAAHKTLDIPDDDEMPNINSYKGIGTGGLIAVILGMLAAGIGASALTKFLNPAVPKPPAVAPIEPQQFRVTFKADDGTQIHVQPVESEGSDPPPAVDTATDVTFPQ